jgi:hypothetical protein
MVEGGGGVDERYFDFECGNKTVIQFPSYSPKCLSGCIACGSTVDSRFGSWRTNFRRNTASALIEGFNAW